MSGARRNFNARKTEISVDDDPLLRFSIGHRVVKLDNTGTRIQEGKKLAITKGSFFPEGG